MANKAVAKVWTFRSTSNPSKTYETLLLIDDDTSCNCPGWTRRVDSSGNRSCRHTRSVNMGTADTECDAFYDYRTKASKGKAKVSAKTSQEQKPKKPAAKKSSLRKAGTPEPFMPVVKRRVRWKE